VLLTTCIPGATFPRLHRETTALAPGSLFLVSGRRADTVVKTLCISADSHVVEPPSGKIKMEKGQVMEQDREHAVRAQATPAPGS
jgi:hypothetical protein